jgi:hypothetical protein
MTQLKKKSSETKGVNALKKKKKQLQKKKNNNNNE